MSGYKSGLSYEKLKAAAAANALETLTAGGYRKNGKKYQATTSYVDSTGDKPRRINLTKQLADTSSAPTNRGGTGKREMEEKVKAWVAQVREDITSVGGLSKDPTKPLSTCVDEYIDSKVKLDANGNNVGIRASTADFYRKCAERLNVYPTLANKPLIDVRDTDVQAWLDEMAKKLARKTIHDSLAIVNQTFTAYVGRDKNPCLSPEVNIPKNVRKTYKNRNSNRPNVLNEGGIMRLNDMLDEREDEREGFDPLPIAARLALHTGMRCGEICALTWGNCDFINGLIYIDKAIEESIDNGVRIGYVADPKTESSIRSIAITADLRDILLDEMSKVRAALEEMPEGDRPDIEELYVINGTSEEFVLPHKLSAAFSHFTNAKKRRILGTEGTPITLHNLRDTFATISLKQHPQFLAEISRTLGHAKIQMTLDKYVGYDPQDQRLFMDTVCSTFSQRTPQDIEKLTGTNG